ncbi:uncharacterized protein [Spinacia oleracea]|uniref:DUF8039 domain-containing protein n=1 Tax=Spinacia oleracea TaxID=3562 RepID=A0ABM3R706_SPIOL|nr:uncharacterized protein LOC130466858 [Spinacia oleracea]
MYLYNFCMPKLGVPKYHTNVTNSSLPFREIKEMLAVRLAVIDEYNGNLVVVANVHVEPWPNDLVHHTKMMETHYKVGIDKPYSEFGEIDLPVPTLDGLTKLGETEGSYLQWPKELVLFDNEVMSFIIIHKTGP